MKKETIRKLGIVAIFAIAMAFLEAVVVIYLRKIFYAGSFDFPLRGFIEPQIISIEVVREFFTIVMLACIAILAGKKLYEKLAYFVYAFAVWDIFYYVWLKATLAWPQSLFTWDVLFLIPWVWVGPVIAPIILSLTMILLAFVILHLSDKGKKAWINLNELIVMLSGAIIVLFTFLYDYGRLICSGRTDLIASYFPTDYNWAAFAIGWLLILLSIIIFYRRTIKLKNTKR
jgi:hypothetical protein